MPSIRFAKVESVGNHFVLVEAFEAVTSDWTELARLAGLHRFGIGSDGLLVISPSSVGDFRFRMFNPDGTEDMCGNGLRCAGLYVSERRLTSKREIVFETKDGLRETIINSHDHGKGLVWASMGKPSLRASDIPASGGLEELIDYPLVVGQETFELTCVAVGTPHAVIRAEVEDFWREVPKVSREIGSHPLFPEGLNVTWYSPGESGEIRARTWERGVGPTLGCGTGACAALVTAHIHGLSGRSACVRFPGGDLSVEWRDDGDIWSAGLASIVFDGIVEIA